MRGTKRTCRSVLQCLRRLARLPVREQLTTLHTLLVFGVLESSIRWMRLPRLATLAGVGLAVESQRGGSAAGFPPELRLLDGGGVDGPDDLAVNRAVRSVRRIGRAWPFGAGSCLRESLALGHLLRSRSPVLHIGVASVEQHVAAHAWLEVDGRAYGDRPGFVELRTYQQASAT